MSNIFFDLTVIICLAAILSLVFKFLKQPQILAYVLTGILIGPLGLFQLGSQDFLKTMAQFGITLLLFMVGLEIRFSDIKSLGKPLLLASLAQIFFTFAVSYSASFLLGFNFLTSIYIGIALTFSSTIIVVKILSDKRDLHSLYGKFSLGILLAQDILAIFALMILSGFSSQQAAISIPDLSWVFLKAIVLFGLVIYLSQNIFPRVIEAIAKSPETLFLVSLAWVFGLSAFVSSPYVGFSIEIGGFLAGLSLANSIANYQIIAKAKILRDFFIVTFFVILGIQMSFSNIQNILFPAIVLSVIVLVGKPLIIMTILGALGYKKRISFLTGVSLSQISEFSLIVIFLGNKLGQINDSVVSLITLVGIVSFMVSTYMIIDSKKLYLQINKYLSFFERKDTRKDEAGEGDGLENLDNHVVIIGGDQMGRTIIDALEDMDVELVVVDFDPVIVRRLEHLPVRKTDKKTHRLFGDISDLDIQERAKLDNAKLVISTIPDIEDNLILLKELKHENRKAKIVVMALDGHDAKLLYKSGADYVVLPHLAGGRQIAKLLTEDKLDKIESLKTKDLEFLN